MHNYDSSKLFSSMFSISLPIARGDHTVPAYGVYAVLPVACIVGHLRLS